MAKSNGIKDLKQAAKLLNKHAPDGESLAYINPDEAKLLKSHGGSGIMTVAGVPTYGAIWDFAKKFIPDTWEPALEAVGTGIQNVGNWLGYGKQDTGKTDKQGNKIYTPGRSIVNDAMSIWAGLEAKKSQEGLNEHEQKLYNDLKAQMAAAETQFALNVGEGPKVENVPTTIEDVASYTDVTLPTMKTTPAAEGGRIGYSNGGIYEKALMDAWRTYQDQGGTLSLEEFAEGWMKAMMKGNAEGGRIGYDAGGNYEAKIKELMDKGLSRELAEMIVMSESSSDRYDLKHAQGGRIGYAEGGDDVEWRKIYNKYKAKQIALGQEFASFEEFIDQHRVNEAQGGRIGYNLGGIGAMDPRIGYANGMGPHWDVPTFSEGVEQMYESTPSGVNQITDEEFYQNIKPMGTLEQDISGKPQLNRDDLISQTVMEMLNQLIAMRDRGMIDQTLSDEDLLNTAWSNVRGNYLDEERKQYQPENLGLAHGGRIGAKEGGIMPLLNLGGMEKDYRQDGGFVPIGRREKADDVPARLSKNEFVFTADAVRAAGGGDIDKGAQRMYNVMKNLEAGGEISEQSQGQV